MNKSGGISKGICELEESPGYHDFYERKKNFMREIISDLVVDSSVWRLLTRKVNFREAIGVKIIQVGSREERIGTEDLQIVGLENFFAG